jgi:CHASE1-domain containing sensor protein
MGSALGYFRAGIWEPYQSGQLEPTRPSRAALVGVGLAATQSSRDVENAADNIARDAVLCDALAAPLAELGELLASLGAATDSDKVFSDAVDPEALTAVAKAQALFNTVVEVSREHGMTITPTKPNLF